MTHARRKYDSVDRQRRLHRTDMFNLAGRFDRRRFWIYAVSVRRGAIAIGERAAGLRCQFRLMASLELLTIVGTDARPASIKTRR
jgi:uncharacterized membrane protein YhaH (DUF805 family)